MGVTKSTIVLCTLEFPFGTKENFLECEIIYLAKYFDQVYILPSSKPDSNYRKTPSNVEIIIDLTRISSKYKPVLLLPYLKSLFQLYFFCLLHSRKRTSYVTYFKSIFHHFYNDFRKVSEIKKIVESYGLKDAIFYDYWLLNSSLSLIHLKQHGILKTIIARTHRFDLYDEDQVEGVMPFKEYKIKWLDKIFTISRHGEKYLLSQTPGKYHYKISNSYLGVNSAINIPDFVPEKTIVSCSSLSSIKQVDKIALALGQIKMPFKWIHFGEGPEYEKVKKIAENFPQRIDFVLIGFLENKKLLKFYQQNYISCFISLSSSEGLPVSMMEAQSFGIPIIAPSVNGIPEIVREHTGVLLPKNYTLIDVSKLVEAILKEDIKFDRNRILEFFHDHFDGEINYRQFARTIKEIPC